MLKKDKIKSFLSLAILIGLLAGLQACTGTNDNGYSYPEPTRERRGSS